jgi:hypothetical protein
MVRAGVGSQDPGAGIGQDSAKRAQFISFEKLAAPRDLNRATALMMIRAVALDVAEERTYLHT